MSDDLPYITIAIPFYNAEHTLLDAIRSVFAQTHQKWELLLIDDGSTDASLRLAKSICDSRVRVYSDGDNKRLAARLNEAAQLARYDYVARMDADDLMTRDRIERQLSVLVNEDDVDLVSSGLVSMTDDLRPSGIRVVKDGYQPVARSVLAGRAGITHAAVLARRSWFLRNPYDESLRVSQDTNLWIRACGKGDLRVKIIPEFMYFYREDGNVTYEKIMEAYRIHRHTIIHRASQYALADRARVYVSSLFKSWATSVLNRIGRLDLLRSRRNSHAVSAVLVERIDAEIASILDTPLPQHMVAGLDHSAEI